MKTETLTVGLLGTCCYLVGQEERDDCVIIDPGAEPERIRAALGNRKPAAILLTHGHFDHIGGVDALRDICPRVFIHSLDAPYLTDPDLNAGLDLLDSPVTARPATDLVEEGQILHLAGMEIQVLHTPGHTPGGVCYRIGDALFSGDTMFRHGWGRTDLPGGDENALFRSLRRLVPLARSMRVYPGHDA